MKSFIFLPAEKMGTPDKDFLEYMLSQIVDFPQDVHVERTVDEMGVLLSVRANKADVGKIIGKGGQTAVALRTLLRVIGSKLNARINMKVLEPETSTS